jgi:hypothetical protein
LIFLFRTTRQYLLDILNLTSKQYGNQRCADALRGVASGNARRDPLVSFRLDPGMPAVGDLNAFRKSTGAKAGILKG